MSRVFAVFGSSVRSQASEHKKRLEIHEDRVYKREEIPTFSQSWCDSERFSVIQTGKRQIKQTYK